MKTYHISNNTIHLTPVCCLLGITKQKKKIFKHTVIKITCTNFAKILYVLCLFLNTDGPSSIKIADNNIHTHPD